MPENYGPDHTHVLAVIETARAMGATRCGMLAGQALESRPWRAARMTAQHHLGWIPLTGPGPVSVLETAPPGVADQPTTVDHRPLMQAWAAGYRAMGGAQRMITAQIVAWTALAVAARNTLPAHVYADLTAPWAQVVGRAHPDDIRTSEDSMWGATQ